jgi:hypothetical protein
LSRVIANCLLTFAWLSGEFAREVLRLPRPVIRHDTIEARLSGLLLFVPA